VLGTESAIHIVAIGPEILWVRRTEERPKSNSTDARRLRQVSFDQWSYGDAHFSVSLFSSVLL
jgi:hypothetical protein